RRGAGSRACRCRLRAGRDRPAGPVLEVAPTGAEPVVMAALDDRLAVLEADGHLTFWQVAAP
ncbi:MAG TPA: hypothetical protein PKU97_01260, partial [Kofleriaceae bacterium]|nr:hypothetical protein [Kofleriaceae bacterium]